MFTHKPHDSEHETEQDAREQIRVPVFSFRDRVAEAET